MDEDAILKWVLELYESKVDVIESVDRKTLQVLIRDNDHLAVLFCKFISENNVLACLIFFLLCISDSDNNCDRCDEALGKHTLIVK